MGKTFFIAMTCPLLLLFSCVQSGNNPANEKTAADSAVVKSNAVDNFTVGGVPFVMVKVEGDTFFMGATAEQKDADDGETPLHKVTLSDYYIGATEVTQALWKAVMGDNPSYFEGDERPAESVSWNDVQHFLSKLNAKTDKQFRLPTEAEWEFAARGGNKGMHCQYAGENNLASVAWYVDNSNGQTHPVAQKQPNELGLYDMSGNVCEWCGDWYGCYASDSLANPKGPLMGYDRVRRGGDWAGNAWSCRVSYRGWENPRFRANFIGFRLALTLRRRERNFAGPDDRR